MFRPEQLLLLLKSKDVDLKGLVWRTGGQLARTNRWKVVGRWSLVTRTGYTGFEPLHVGPTPCHLARHRPPVSECCLSYLVLESYVFLTPQ